MAECPQGNPPSYPSRYTYRLRRAGAEFRIVMKKVVLVNCTAPLKAMAICV